MPDPANDRRDTTAKGIVAVCVSAVGALIIALYQGNGIWQYSVLATLVGVSVGVALGRRALTKVAVRRAGGTPDSHFGLAAVAAGAVIVALGFLPWTASLLVGFTGAALGGALISVGRREHQTEAEGDLREPGDR
jgi:hypothetical protein